MTTAVQFTSEESRFHPTPASKSACSATGWTLFYSIKVSCKTAQNYKYVVWKQCSARLRQLAGWYQQRALE